MNPLSVPEYRGFLWRLVLALQQTTVLSVERKCIHTTLPGMAEREPGCAKLGVRRGGPPKSRPLPYAVAPGCS
jgi:hypothetical protein